MNNVRRDPFINTSHSINQTNVCIERDTVAGDISVHTKVVIEAPFLNDETASAINSIIATMSRCDDTTASNKKQEKDND